jgi:hypothetical protein
MTDLLDLLTRDADPCRFCGGNPAEPDHARRCDGRQGRVEAAERPVLASPHFNGPAYEPEYDHARLTGQLLRIWTTMKDRRWRTLHEIALATGDPESSISAQLRHLRKPRFGSHTVERRARGDRAAGLHEYRLIPTLANAG